MSRAAIPRIALVLLLAAAGTARAEGDKPPPPPTTVSTAQTQVERWTAAFATWQAGPPGATWESPREAAIRKASRLRIVPTPTPLLGTQRRLDGHAVVVSLGLIALLDDLLLAESPTLPPGCFNAYAKDVAGVLKHNREAARAYAKALLEATQGTADGSRRGPAPAASPVNAWPRFGARIAVNKAWPDCASVKPAALDSAATRAWAAGNADSLVLWLLTHQAAVLAGMPGIETPSAKPASAPEEPKWPDPSADKAGCKKEIEKAASAPYAAPSPVQQAHLALCTTERSDKLRSLAWLQRYLPLLGN